EGGFAGGGCYLGESTQLHRRETVKRLAAWVILATVGVALSGCFVEEGGYGRGGGYHGGGYGYGHHYYRGDYYH
ncbi:MAG TPA: hypothetical protein VF113_08525, partial [Stellaceae bacterium]